MKKAKALLYTGFGITIVSSVFIAYSIAKMYGIRAECPQNIVTVPCDPYAKLVTILVVSSIVAAIGVVLIGYAVFLLRPARKSID